MASKGNYRAFWNDYRDRAIYMITLKKRVSSPPFSEIDHLGNPIPRLTKAGSKIREALASLKLISEGLKLWQYVIMPDHIHFLIKVENRLAEPLGNYIARLKVMINNKVGTLVFEPGFNDQIINHSRSLDVIFQYIRSNPHRLAVRRERPEYFRRVNDIEIAGNMYQAYGNMHLLNNPFKEQVVCHRSDSYDIIKVNHDRWIYTAANGGVLVSPFISREEKAIRAEAETVGAKIILITHEAFPERFKPSAHDFELCERGRLLIISLCLKPKTPLNRQICLAMNTLAEAIATVSQ